MRLVASMAFPKSFLKGKYYAGKGYVVELSWLPASVLSASGGKGLFSAKHFCSAPLPVTVLSTVFLFVAKLQKIFIPCKCVFHLLAFACRFFKP